MNEQTDNEYDDLEAAEQRSRKLVRELESGHADLTKINLLTALSAHRIACALEELVSSAEVDPEELAAHLSAVETKTKDKGGHWSKE